MNPQRYKLMMSYLPGMATIVNSFQSPEVQRAVYESLMEALNVKLESEVSGAGPGDSARHRTLHSQPRLQKSAIATRASDSTVLDDPNDLAHDLAEGDSIHAVVDRQEAMA